MDFKIANKEKENVPYFLIKAHAGPQSDIPNARGLEASGQFGRMRFYEIECPGFSIWHSSYDMAQRTCMYGTMEAPMLELHCTLSNTMRYKLEGLNKATLQQGQFNISYAPFINNVAWFQKGETYTTFDIHFSREYLEKLIPFFPLLHAFFEKTDKGIAGMLSKYHGQLTRDMNTIIRQILRCEYSGDIKNLYLQAKVLELLILALDQIAVGKPEKTEMVLRPYDIEKIREAHDYLLRNMDNPCTLIELSHKVGINDFKLKKGFKQLYGTTVYEFLIDARMEKARILLLETETSAHEIALITGYKNLSSFITAFKKKMGYSPGSFRKLKRGNGSERL